MPSKGVGQVVNRSGLSEIFGVAPVTVDQWRRRGCPYVKRGGRGQQWEFNTADVAEWLRDQAREEVGGQVLDDKHVLERRKLAVKIESDELKLAREKRLVAPLDEIERALAGAFAEVRANMRNIPGRVVTVLLGETNERRFKARLLEEIDQALEALADTDLAAEVEDEGSDQDEAE